MDNRKDYLKWQFTLHQNRLDDYEQFLLTMYLYANWNIGKIAKFAHVEAPIVKEIMKRAVRKL